MKLYRYEGSKNGVIAVGRRGASSSVKASEKREKIDSELRNEGRVRPNRGKRTDRETQRRNDLDAPRPTETKRKRIVLGHGGQNLNVSSVQKGSERETRAEEGDAAGLEGNDERRIAHSRRRDSKEESLYKPKKGITRGDDVDRFFSADAGPERLP